MPTSSQTLARRLTFAATLTLATAAAPAAVVTRQVNVTLTAIPDGPNNMYALDVNNDGVPDLTFETEIGVPTDPTFGSFAVINQPFAAVNETVVDAGTGGGFPTVSRLSAGTVVGPSSNFSNVNDQGNLYYIDAFDPPSGNYAAASGYVGLRFASGTNTLYGYAYVTVKDLFDPTNPLAITIGQVGYQSTPGGSITLPPIAVPEPVAASMVAVVATGLLGRRRRSR